MRFDRKTFFDEYRRQFGKPSQQQVNGLERLLGNIESDVHIPDGNVGIYWASYILATVKRETAHTFTPIHEYGGKAYFIKRYGGQTRKGKELGNDSPEEGYYYAGKGDVQTTGESNYEKAEVALRREYPEIVTDFERRTGKVFDLTVGDQPGDTLDPQNILDPAISYAVMSYGMRTGMFTGRKLSQYTRGKTPNYLGMRAIVNGTDHDDEIAADAQKFETILKVSAAAKLKTSDEPETIPEGSTLDGQTGSPSVPQGEAPPTETTKVVETPTGANVETTRNEQSVDETAFVEAPAPQGVFKKLTAGITALFSGTILYTTLEKFGGMSFSTQAIIIICFVIFIAFLGFCFWMWLDAWKQNNRVKIEAESKTNIYKKDIKFTEAQ